MIKPWRDRWIKSKTVKEVYEARWVWYHTLLAILMLILVIVQIGMFIELAIMIGKMG